MCLLEEILAIQKNSTWPVQSTSVYIILLSILKKAHPLEMCLVMRHSTKI